MIKIISKIGNESFKVGRPKKENKSSRDWGGTI